MRISKTVTGSFFISSNSGLFSTAVPEIFPVTRCYNLKIRIHFIILTDFHQADNLRSYINTIQNRTFRSVISKKYNGPVQNQLHPHPPTNNLLLFSEAVHLQKSHFWSSDLPDNMPPPFFGSWHGSCWQLVYWSLHPPQFPVFRSLWYLFPNKW